MRLSKQQQGSGAGTRLQVAGFRAAAPDQAIVCVGHKHCPAQAEAEAAGLRQLRSCADPVRQPWLAAAGQGPDGVAARLQNLHLMRSIGGQGCMLVCRTVGRRYLWATWDLDLQPGAVAAGVMLEPTPGTCLVSEEVLHCGSVLCVPCAAMTGRAAAHRGQAALSRHLRTRLMLLSRRGAPHMLAS